MSRAGHHASVLVENYPPAQEVLRHHFPEAHLLDDVRDVPELPSDIDLLVAGFPCQDLSSVGQKRGIGGTRSKLVGEVVRLLRARAVPWVLLENVPFLRQLAKGHALTLITSALEELGYEWAYRVLDTEAFGLPQRRNRWFLLASLEGDPRSVLLPDSVERPQRVEDTNVACGFYWTEGMRSLGWAVDAVPPIKGGSSIGVPSPPAIRLPGGGFILPDIRDAERLQGFDPDWTRPAENVARTGYRWQLVGNAVSVPVATWIGERLTGSPGYDPIQDERISPSSRWPAAAWSEGEHVFASRANAWPLWKPRASLTNFLKFPGRPLSLKAAKGFLARTRRGSLNFPEGFIDEVTQYIEAMPEAA